MCYILRCFGWMLDIIQRALTFILACIMCAFICCGLTVACMAGLAYGYNYSMAEFMTFSRSDVSVFVRRGQFSDKTEMYHSNRRTGAENDLFSSNATDYQDISESKSKPLEKAWIQAQDSKKYEEKLTKYVSRSHSREKGPFSRGKTKLNKTSLKPMIGLPTHTPFFDMLISSTEISDRNDDKDSELKMRNVLPIKASSFDSLVDTNSIEHLPGNIQNNIKVMPINSTETPDIRIILKDSRVMPIQRSNTTRFAFSDYPGDFDYENIIYKPV